MDRPARAPCRRRPHAGVGRDGGGLERLGGRSHGAARRCGRRREPEGAREQLAGRRLAHDVVEHGQAERARGVVSNEDLPWNRRDHALFVGYAPYDNPRYAVSVVVEHGGGGSAVAAPVARDAILRVLHGDIPPLSSYPANQRGRIETDLNALREKLRLSGTSPAPGPEQQG